MEGGWEGVASDTSSLGLSPSGDDGVSGEDLSSCWKDGGFNDSWGKGDGTVDSDDRVIVVDSVRLGELWMDNPGAHGELLVQVSVVDTSHSNSVSGKESVDFAVTSRHDVGGGDDSSSAEVASTLLKGDLVWSFSG